MVSVLWHASNQFASSFFSYQAYAWKKLALVGVGSGIFGATWATYLHQNPDIEPKPAYTHLVTKTGQCQTNTEENRVTAFYKPSSISSTKHATLESTIDQARELCNRIKDELGLPGLVVGVSVNGTTLWQEGIQNYTVACKTCINFFQNSRKYVLQQSLIT